MDKVVVKIIRYKSTKKLAAFAALALFTLLERAAIPALAGQDTTSRDVSAGTSPASAGADSHPKGTKPAAVPKKDADDDKEKPIVQNWVPGDIKTNRSYNQEVLDRIDRIVRKHFFNHDLVTSAWIPALEHNREKILASKNLVELFNSINSTLAAFKCSHTEFATSNDEIFYFLHDLFGRWNPKLTVAGDFVGFMTGPPRFAVDRVRYVVDDSPAAKAGLQAGDRIISVDSKPYLGQSNFFGLSGKKVSIQYERAGKKAKCIIVPVKKDEYMQYVEGIRKSARTYQLGGHTVGYVHDWCGGNDAHGALDEVLEGKLCNTDGLILDLRDGYGGNSLDDLDRFYRNPAGYPQFILKDNKGRAQVSTMTYDKPVVALINDGARSGKELLAYSLKTSKRAPLVGITTAGAVLAGKLFPLDKRTALYLAVADGTVGGVRLEGVGVKPDIEIGDDCSEAGKQAQLKAAEDLLLLMLQKPKKHYNIAPAPDGDANFLLEWSTNHRPAQPQ
jgi:carboxyl-terminal processing protease